MKRLTVRRAFLYSGLFLAVLGGVLVAADAGVIDTPALIDVLRFWPLIPIAIGAAIVLRRSPVSLPLGLLAAAIPGLVLGSTLAAIPRFGSDCGVRGAPAIVADRTGGFDGPASVSVSIGCGDLTVRTSQGSTWRMTAANTNRVAPAITASSRSLDVDDTHDHGANVFDAGRDAWDLTLPTSPLDTLDVTTFIDRGDVDLAGAQVGRLDVTANASDVTVDASAATVAQVSAAVNVGRLSLLLPSSDLTATLRVGAGDLRICAPADLGIRVTAHGTPGSFNVEGLNPGSTWRSANYASAAHRADLTVNAALGAVSINPIGGCK
jgi:hypothetical protein